ncbi:MAG TPA: rRNA maturation RNase YbeY [Xanthobacteraceae bacterium]|nr:rRNA maturation RNase YbeY [Xanthobacteraceae bacterium]
MTARRQRQRGKAGKLLIDVLIQSPRWRARPRAGALVRRAIRAAANLASKAPAELAIVLTDDSGIRVLNREWRRVDAPTNVLSFPAANTAGPRWRAAAGRRTPPRLLGDIVIAYETVAREAAAERKPFDHHLVHLAVHGFLHLLGHDHATRRDAAKMEGLETAVLARLGIPDPYAAQGRE